MLTTEKIDLFKQHKDEYATPKKPVLIKMGPVKYLAIEGQGAPGGEEFQERIGALYGMAFTIKMTRKFAGLQDYAVCKLETIYLHDAPSVCFSDIPMDQWRWKLLIRTPEFIKQADLDKAVEALIKKPKAQTVKDVRLERIEEGTVVQMLHVGPYDKEGETVAVMEAFMKAQGYRRDGAHHEIYLSDPRRVPPERLKTILRFPVRKP